MNRVSVLPQMLSNSTKRRSLMRKERPVNHSEGGTGTRVTLFEGHTAGIRSVLEMPSGQIWSCSHDDSIRIWDKNSGECLKTLEGHTGGVYGIRLIAGERVISWAGDSTVKIWSTSGELLATLEGHEHEVIGATVLSDGQILSWSCDRTLRIWNIKGNTVKILKGHTNIVSGALQHPNGQILSWGHDGTLRLWDGNGELLKVLNGHSSSVLDAQCFPDGRILSSLIDDSLKLWSIQGELLQTLTGSWSGAKILSDGHLLSWCRIIGPNAGSIAGSIALWDTMPEFKIDNIWRTELFGDVMVLADDRIVSSSYLNEKLIRIWDKKGQLLKAIPGGESWTDGVLLLSNGRILTWGEDENTIRILDGVPVSENDTSPCYK